MGNAELWLSFLVAAALMYGLWLYWRGDYSVWETVLFLPAYMLTRLMWRVHFTNDPPEAIRSGAILAANHRSSVDPMFIQLAARRRVHWMVAKEYCQNIFFGPILRALQVIPTNRTGTDITSTKIAMSLARQGKLVGMFPEGRINVTCDPLLPLRAGAAMIAAKASVPIIPILIKGSPYEESYSVISPFLMRTRVSVTFGNPVYPTLKAVEAKDAKVTERPVDHGESVSGSSGASIPDKVALQDAVSEEESGSEDESPQVARSRRSILNEQAASLIRGWADEMLVLSNRTDFEVPLGSSAARRRN